MRWTGIDSGIDFGPPNVGGSPPDPRLEELDRLAVEDMNAGRFATPREAAKAYLNQYAQRDYAPDEWDERNAKLRDVARRIKRKFEGQN